MAVILDRKLQFRRSIEVNTPLGMSATWREHGTPVSASRRDVSDQERIAAGGIQASIVSRFLVRSSSFTRAISPIDRFTHGGKEWDIQGIKEAPMERHAFLEITARARADV